MFQPGQKSMVCLGREQAVVNFEFPVERQPVAVEVGLEAFPFGVYHALCASSSRHRSTPLHFFYFPADSPPRLSAIPAMLVSEGDCSNSTTATHVLALRFE
ncbi:unnamed protein product [Somion occarium]|uniref:Uncharacterized protein n=1 Tax=Somion occarium TaxID=3059160 RepID=A0ABP1DUY6_9APHY